MNDDQRRRELADLLRSRRELLRPEDYGLAHGVRRRTSGLRREEVAMLSSVSPSWYTWLEQGRKIRPSLQTLRRISQVLRLSEQEWLYASLLAQFEPNGDPPTTISKPAISITSLQNILDAFTTAPAVLYNSRFDILAANAAARSVYGHDVATATKWEHNMLWRFFMDKDRRKMYPDAVSDLGIQNLIETLRMNWASNHDGVEELIDELRHTSNEFDHIWNARKVAKLAIVPGRVRLPGHKEAISIQYTRFYVSELAGHAIAALVPTTSQHSLVLQKYLDQTG
ncbi:MAG: helix-turn-helix transcriptional regulator [Acidobacteriota bacterium]